MAMTNAERQRRYRERVKARLRDLEQLQAAVSSQPEPLRNGSPQPRKSRRIKPSQQEIVAYGKRLWPRREDPISYDELCQAVWFFDFLLRQYPADWRPRSRVLQTRQLLKWIPPHESKGWELAVRELCNCYEAAPEAECRFPPVPINFGL